MVLGIDFGTSNSFMATMVGTQPSYNLAGVNNQVGIPTLYLNLGGEDCFGIKAKALGFENPDKIVKEIKKKIRLDSNLSYNADLKKIVVKILKNLIETAVVEAELQHLFFLQSDLAVTELTVTVPTGIGERQNMADEYHQFIKSAAIEASGLPEDKVHILAEPIAAAYHCLYKEKSKKTILVYDLGGGTIDISIVEGDPTTMNYSVKATSGNLSVGGTAWDQALVEIVVNKAGGELPANPKEKYIYDEAIVAAKHVLSARETAYVEYKSHGKDVDIKVSREEFELATKGLLELTIDEVKKALTQYKNNFNSENIDYIVLVGGASQMPQVMARLKREFPNTDIHFQDPEKAIAIGAALSCGNDDTAVIEQNSITMHTYGIGCRDDENKPYISNILIKGTAIDKKNKCAEAREGGFHPRYADQRELEVKIYETDSLDQVSNINDGKINGIKINVPVNPKEGQSSRSCMFAIKVLLTSDNIIKVYVYDQDDQEVGFEQKRI